MDILQHAPKRQRSKPEAIILRVIASLENRFGLNETAEENIALTAVADWLRGLEQVLQIDPENEYVIVRNRDRVVRMRIPLNKKRSRPEADCA